MKYPARVQGASHSLREVGSVSGSICIHAVCCIMYLISIPRARVQGFALHSYNVCSVLICIHALSVNINIQSSGPELCFAFWYSKFGFLVRFVSMQVSSDINTQSSGPGFCDIKIQSWSPARALLHILSVELEEHRGGYFLKYLSLYQGDEYSIYWVFACSVFLKSSTSSYVYTYVVVYHMQSQFIAKYEISHLVTRKYKTCHNSSRKITVLAIFRSLHKKGLNFQCTVKLRKVTTSTILLQCLFC